MIANRQKALRLDLPAVRRLVHEVWNIQHPVSSIPHRELSLVFVSDSEIASLNERFLKHSGPTDVISFEHGEIVISTDRAVAQSKRFNTASHDELALYIVHGLLHLAGYDDTSPAPRRTMQRRQRSLVKELRNRLDLRGLLR